MTDVSEQNSRPISIANWISINKNSLIGVFDLCLPSGMIINGCMLHQSGSNGQSWVALPGAPQVEHGQLKRAGDGKLMYKTIVRFKSRDIYARFQTPILEELRRLGHL